jgi:hypothetical protein
MLQHYVSHIPARHFKMVRYSGFLANRKQGTLLPKVYDALVMTVKRPGFAGETPTVPVHPVQRPAASCWRHGR